MARRLIGLDVGTNAVTAAEVTPGSPPRVELFGQVALPRDAMREGEVVDDVALTEAVARLREEIGLKKAPVRVGIATPRLIVRQVEMPEMSQNDLASALRFQAADLIPIPIEEAVLDFAILETGTADDGDQQTMRVLLAAAQEAVVMRLVAAVEAGGVPVAAVDLVPLALIRALGRRVPAGLPAVPTVPAVPGGVALGDHEDDVGAEGIVSFGGGVTAIAVHEAGLPRFVRVLGSGGRELTDAIATELEIPPDAAEAVKRQISTGATDELVTRARTAIDRPLSVLLDDVRSSVDYYRNQSGAARVARVVVTGGASQLPGLVERLGALLGVPVEVAQPRETLKIGDIGFPLEEYPRLDPYLPAAVGLALGGAGVGTVVDLLPRTRRATSPRSKSAPKLAAAGVGLLAVLAVPTVLTKQSTAHARHERTVVEQAGTQLRAEAQRLAPVKAEQQQLDQVRAAVPQMLQTDVSWHAVLGNVQRELPPGVVITSFQAQITNPARGAAPAGTSPAGATAPGAAVAQVSVQGAAPDYPTVAAWLDALAGDPSHEFATPWVTNASKGDSGITFTSTAQLTASAHTTRADQYVKGTQR